MYSGHAERDVEETSDRVRQNARHSFLVGICISPLLRLMRRRSCRYLRLNRATLTMVVTRRCDHARTKRRRVFGGPTKDRRMSTQVVLITGGLTGIGRAAAVAFAKKGAQVGVAGGRDQVGE